MINFKVNELFLFRWQIFPRKSNGKGVIWKSLFRHKLFSGLNKLSQLTNYVNKITTG